jgi:Cu+-exporting ATPase
MEPETLIEHKADEGGMAEQSTPYRIIDLGIEGMTCASCVARVEKSLRKVEGVEEVAVNLATNRARVKMHGDVDPAALEDRVERAGYKAVPISAEHDMQTSDEAIEYRRNFLIAAPLAAIVMIVSMLPMVVPALETIAMRWMYELNLLQFLLTTVVMFYSGRRFFVLAGRSARHLTADMNTLVAVGTGAAYLFSTVVTFFPKALPGIDAHEVYFDSSAVVIALILLGRWLEAHARSQASDAIRSLMQLAPKIAHRVADKEATSVTDGEVEFIHPGDLLLVRPGESVPVDGVIARGATALDESMMTGESLPVEKTEGGAVIGGTINTDRSFVMQAEGVGDETMLARIIRAVEDAQSSKAPVQRLADRIASIFVPIVMGIALATFIGWLAFGGADLAHALIHAVAVLVIACPCAMGLAVPTAVIAGTGRGARQGILIRNAEALERAARVHTVVFDKTGTLTHGRPEVVGIRAFDTFAEHDLLQLAASVEGHSEHPIARGIVRQAERMGIQPLPVEDFRTTPGIGVQGVVAGREVVAGRKGTGDGSSTTEEGDFAGSTIIHVTVDNRPAGIIALADTVKPEARGAIASLKEMGFEVAMLTGDSYSVAREIARTLGIDQVIAEVLPHQKGERIRELQGEGKVVAMVGDGVNDAPALALADVSIAMATGTDMAMSVADITLLNGEIARLPDAVALSRRTMRIIRQNLFWAFIYNVIGIPLAVLGLLSPIIAGAAMAMSSVSVVSNSLRLKK